jgi:hypothetical protein
MAIGKPLLTMALSASLAACSSGVETRISSSGIRVSGPQEIMLSIGPEASPELRTAYALVTSDLTKKGYAMADEAPLHLAVTVDARDADLALKAGASNLSAAKKKKAFQNCNDKEYRVGVTLVRVADGGEIYRGRSSEYHCNMTIADALPDLVKAALADFGKPRGSYVVTRGAVE